MTDKKEEVTQKAEAPLNSMGFGYDSTLNNGPHEKSDLHYNGSMDNYGYTYCGACAFYEVGYCKALEESIDILGSCDAHIHMSYELELRWEQLHKRVGRLEREQREFEASQKEEDKSLEDGKTEFEVKFASMDEDLQIVYGIALEPDETDAHGDTITQAEIEKAAHGYALTPMVVGEGHIKKAKATPVETYIAPVDFELGGQSVKKGSWVMAIKVHSKKLWKGVKDGSFTGLSIGAFVKKRPYEDKEEVK